jgi:hypothetical protein
VTSRYIIRTSWKLSFLRSTHSMQICRSIKKSNYFPPLSCILFRAHLITAFLRKWENCSKGTAKTFWSKWRLLSGPLLTPRPPSPTFPLITEIKSQSIYSWQARSSGMILIKS